MAVTARSPLFARQLALFVAAKLPMVLAAVVAAAVVLTGVDFVTIVLTSYAIRTAILVPLILALFWRRMTGAGFVWGTVAAMLILDVSFLAGVFVLSRRAGWSPLHILSLAGGGAIAYGVHAFIGHPVVPGSMLAARISNGIFLAAAIEVILIGARRTGRFLSKRHIAQHTEKPATAAQ